MQLIILYTTDIPKRPDSIKLIEDYGHETIVDTNGNVLAEGNVHIIQGESKDISNWLRSLDSFWTTNNPMAGNWVIQHIK